MIGDLDFTLTGDERLLRDSTRKALEKAAPHRRLMAGADGTLVDMWPLARELGWPGLMVPEAQGGLGMPLSAAALVAEEAGRGLFSGPFLTTAVLAPSLLTGEGQRAIADGEMVVSLAETTTFNLSIAESAAPQISARCDLVEYPSIATHLLLVDRRAGLTTALVPIPDTRSDRQPFDVTCPVACFELDHISVAPDSVRRFPEEAIDELLSPFHVAIAAELVGVARAALERATIYARERQQFGVAIGSFQAIKHKLADTYVQTESAALAVRQAALDGDTGSALAARALASDAALRATGDCIQVHGGFGFSWECEAHLYLKRARRLVTVLTRPDQLRRKVADRLVARVLSPA